MFQCIISWWMTVSAQKTPKRSFLETIMPPLSHRVVFTPYDVAYK